MWWVTSLAKAVTGQNHRPILLCTVTLVVGIDQPPKINNSAKKKLIVSVF